MYNIMCDPARNNKAKLEFSVRIEIVDALTFALTTSYDPDNLE